jgi:hypothetical protein
MESYLDLQRDLGEKIKDAEHIVLTKDGVVILSPLRKYIVRLKEDWVLAPCVATVHTDGSREDEYACDTLCKFHQWIAQMAYLASALLFVQGSPHLYEMQAGLGSWIIGAKCALCGRQFDVLLAHSLFKFLSSQRGQCLDTEGEEE